MRNWVLKFADDTKLFGKVQSEVDYIGIQEDLQRLSDWSKEWQMEFNVEKCKVMQKLEVPTEISDTSRIRNS